MCFFVTNITKNDSNLNKLVCKLNSSRLNIHFMLHYIIRKTTCSIYEMFTVWGRFCFFLFKWRCRFTVWFTVGFLLALLFLLLEEVVAGDGEGGHQHYELVEIHLVVFVRVQVVHDLLHQHRVLLRLQTKTQEAT